MKVFIATTRGQGGRTNDFTFRNDGELVGFPMAECGGEAVDGPCGCRRSMSGAESSQGTTTFTVADRPDLDLETYAWGLGAAKAKDGWPVSPDNEHLLAEAAELARLADEFDLGDVLERRGDAIARRKVL